MSFGKWLYSKRKEAGLTQGDLAERAHISTSYVSTLERQQGHSVTGAQPQPDREIVKSLAKAMKFLKRINIEGFNRRSLTEGDFYEICENEQITVLELDVSRSFYLKVMNEVFIVIKKRLRGLNKLYAMFHELAHHFLHGGRATDAKAHFFGLLESRNEIEADAFAVVSLCPLAALANYEFITDFPNRFAQKIYRDRQRLWFLYGV